MQNNNYLIAIDGGGTKTQFCVLEIETGERAYFKSGSSNYKTAGDATVKSNLAGSLCIYMEENGISPQNIKGVIAGVAGCDNELDRQFYHKIFSETKISDDKICVCNDAYLAFGKTKRKHGIVVVAGTGTICLGMTRAKKSLRCGGWGFPISDLGSGLWIASRALTELVIYCDGYGEYHDVYESFREKIGARGFSDIPEIITSYQIRDYASFAKNLMDLADEGDEYCVGLCKESVSHLIKMAREIYNRFSEKDKEDMEFIILGGLFTHASFRKEFFDRLESEIGIKRENVTIIDGKPVDGALQIAKSLFL